MPLPAFSLSCTVAHHFIVPLTSVHPACASLVQRVLSRRSPLQTKTRPPHSCFRWPSCPVLAKLVTLKDPSRGRSGKTCLLAQLPWLAGLTRWGSTTPRARKPSPTTLKIPVAYPVCNVSSRQGFRLLSSASIESTGRHGNHNLESRPLPPDCSQNLSRRNTWVC